MDSMKKIFLIVIILIIPTLTWGQTYYMRADGVAAKGAATACNATSTAMSITTHNATTFSPGDTIYLCGNGGDYKSTIRVPSSGSSGGGRITYTAAPGHTPVVDLSVVVPNTGWTSLGGGIYQRSGYGRVFWEDNVPLNSATTAACTDGNWFYAGGSNLLQYKPTSGTPSDHSLRAVWWEIGSVGVGIDLRERSYINISGITFNRSGYGIGHGNVIGSAAGNVSNLSFYNNKFNQCLWAIWSQVNANYVESDVLIDKNTINYCNSGISAWTNSEESGTQSQYHTRYTITNNTISNMWSIVDGKTWTHAALQSDNWDHEGISFQDVQDSVISGNTIHVADDKSFGGVDRLHTRGIFLYFTNGTVPTSGNTITKNYITGHYRPAIFVDGAFGTGGGVENNTFSYNVIRYDGTNSDHIAFMYYVTQNNLKTGMNYFVNNVVYANGGMGLYFASDYIAGNWKIQNNIIHSPIRAASTNANDNAHVLFSNNIYDNVSDTSGFQMMGGAITYAQWKATYGQDLTGSRIENPLFISSSDFRLQSGSPAINAGVNVGLTTDYLGKAIVGLPDIGAYEYGSSRVPSAPVLLNIH